MSRLFTISQMRAEKSAKIESLLLPDGSEASLDNIEDLLSLTQYADRYSNYGVDSITKSMWREMKVGNYDIFYLTGSFAL